MADKQPYRPSNGTEGHSFMAHFCARCQLPNGDLAMMNFSRRIEWDLVSLWVIGALCLLIFGVALYGGAVQEQEWQKFAKQNNCVVIGHMSDSAGLGVGPSMGGNGGVAVTVVHVPGKTGYRCDDGKEYWR